MIILIILEPNLYNDENLVIPTTDWTVSDLYCAQNNSYLQLGYLCREQDLTCSRKGNAKA